MTSFCGKASWAKMTSPGVKVTALVRHLTKRVNKAEKLFHLSTNIGNHYMAILRVELNMW